MLILAGCSHSDRSTDRGQKHIAAIASDQKSPKNTARLGSLEWYKDQLVAANKVLGAFYEEGDGVPQNFDEAVEWYRKGADGDDPQAQRSMGEMYVKGIGISQNYLQAHMCLNLACSNGEAEACGIRDRLATKMNPAQVLKAQDMASKWKPGPKRTDSERR